jgi:hypothetical protein
MRSMTEPVSLSLGALVSGAKDAGELLDKIGLLDALKNKLVGAPEEASHKLTVALSEVSVSYELLYRTLVRLAHLSFTKEERADSERFLYELSTGELGAAIAKARGHCGVIDNIRQKHLDGLFDRLFRPKRAQDLKDLFVILSQFDNQLMRTLDALDGEGRAAATVILTAVRGNKLPLARALAKRANRELEGPLTKLADGMATLWRVQANIKVKAGATK